MSVDLSDNQKSCSHQSLIWTNLIDIKRAHVQLYNHKILQLYNHKILQLYNHKILQLYTKR